MSEGEETLTGVSEEAPAPFPSWPAVPEPQHFAALVDSAAHVKYAPPVAEDAVEIELTTTGGFGGLAFVWLPLPSWPELLNPQHFIDESAKTAQPCQPLECMIATAVEIPETCVGVDPNVSPQHQTVWSAFRAQVAMCSASSCVTPLMLTLTGTSRRVVVPSPS